MSNAFSWISADAGNKAIDSINKLAQIIALAIAGVWTYKTFFQSVQPSLAVRGELRTGVEWDRQQNDFCMGRLSAVMKNPGTTPLEVTWIRVRGWLFMPKEPLGLSPDRPVYTDETAIEKTTPFFDREFTEDGHHESTTLVGRFVNGVERNDVWQWYFKKVPGQVVYFRVDAKDSEHNEYTGFSTNVEDVCLNQADPTHSPSVP